MIFQSSKIKEWVVILYNEAGKWNKSKYHFFSHWLNTFYKLAAYLTFENSFCPKRIDGLFDKKCRLYAGQQWHVCIVLMVYDKTHNNTTELQMDIYNKMK